MIATLLRAFWGVSILRLGPQDIPFSSALLMLATLSNVGMSVAIAHLRLPLDYSLMVAALELVVLFGLTSSLLYVAQRRQRIVQTLTALMGSGTIISAIALVLMLALPALPQPARLTIFIWNQLVIAHVLAHALSTRFLIGVCLAIGYALFLIQFINFVGRILATAAA